MTQHSDAVEQQRQMLELEKQAKRVVGIDTRYKDGLWYKQTVDYADGRSVTEYRDKRKAKVVENRYEKTNSSSIFVETFLTNSLSNASEVSLRMIQLFKKVSPPIKTSSLGAMNIFQSGVIKLSEISILKSSASLFV